MTYNSTDVYMYLLSLAIQFFFPGLNFIFLFFKCSQEQKKKMEPMIKLNHSVSREMESAHYLQDTKLKIAVDANQKCLGKFHLCRKTKQLQ